MLRPAVIIAAVIALGLAVLGVFLLPDREDPVAQPTPPALGPEPKTEIFTTSPPETYGQARLRAEIDERFPDAPETIHRIALGIADPRIPLSDYRDALFSLTLEEINTSYGRPFPENHPEYTHTLMREAVMSGNTGVAAILAEKGANLSYNDNEMAFQSVTLAPRQRDWVLAFPDFTPGAKLLSLWLRHSDDANITHPLYETGTLLLNTPVNNLTALLLLLESGADPWGAFKVTADDGGFLYELEPFFVRLAGHDRIANEVAFRAALMGYYDNASSEDKDRILEAYAAAVRSLPESSSPRDEAERWALRKALKMIYHVFDTYPSGDIKDFLSERQQSGSGGFYLGERDLHSPYRPSQRVETETPWGPNRWDGVPASGTRR